MSVENYQKRCKTDFKKIEIFQKKVLGNFDASKVQKNTALLIYALVVL